MAPVNADRNLLFGLLALQNGLIDQDQLVSAFRACSRDKGPQIADYLVDRGDLDAEQRGVIEAMVGLHLKKHEGSTEKSLSAIPAGISTCVSLGFLDSPDGEITVHHLGAGLEQTKPESGRDAHRTPTLSVGSTTSDGQRFQVLRPHARGGLGVVSVALDSELHREVAFKQILDSHADDPVSRQRFLLEAEVTGCLEHPGIVPVYSMGAHDGGRPYYAMRFIRGESLKEAIDRFHADEALKHDLGRHSLDLRKLLRRFLDVCNAIDYAHSRGVLHRDIKPGNIIVGKHGETLIVDWGLAKARGRSNADASDERPIVPSSASVSTETLPGSTLGTPAYMSPEQARGDIDQLGPQSDVYSLGATLYCLLTGKPPFEGPAIHVISAVQLGAFQPPRTLVSSIDRALEAVCLKAMALDSSDRYATPKALGEEVERWMADESVAAYAEPWTRTLTRWLARYRTGVTAVGAAMLVALVGLGAVLSVQGQANGQLTAKNRELGVALGREADARKEAETNFLMAQNAVDDYLTKVSENILLKQQDSVDLRGLRQELLNNALSYYKSFVSQRGDDPRLRRQLANAYYRVGEITREIGSLGGAIEAFHSARSIWEPLAAADPVNHELRGRLADCHLAIGMLQSATDDLQAAMTSLTRARDLLESLAREHPDVASYTASLAKCYMRIGINQGVLKSLDQALSTLEKARTIQERLIARLPGRTADQQLLAEIFLATGTLFYERHDDSAALRSFQESQRICRLLLDGISTGPRPVRLLDLLAISYYNIATIQRNDGHNEEASRSFGRSLEYRSALVEAHPSVSQFRHQLGKNLAEIAVVQHDARQDDKAFASIERSIEIIEKLVQSHPDQPLYHHDLARSLNIQGYLYDEIRQNKLAIEVFDRAIAEESRAIPGAPEVDLYKVELCSQLDNLGEQYVDLGMVAEALPHYRRQIVMLQELLTARPGNPDHALKLAEALSRLGNIQRHDGDSSAALESFAKASMVLEPVAAINVPIRGRLGTILTQEACALADLSKTNVALPLLHRAVDLLSNLGTVSTLDDRSREWLSESLWELARVLRATRETGKAAECDVRRVALWEGQPPAKLASSALRETTQAVLIGYGKTPITDPARFVRQLDLDQAAANLRLAISLGFKDRTMLRNNPDSEVLLSREDVRPLIMDMAFPDWPFGEQ